MKHVSSKLPSYLLFIAALVFSGESFAIPISDNTATIRLSTLTVAPGTGQVVWDPAYFATGKAIAGSKTSDFICGIPGHTGCADNEGVQQSSGSAFASSSVLRDSRIRSDAHAERDPGNASSDVTYIQSFDVVKKSASQPHLVFSVAFLLEQMLSDPVTHGEVGVSIGLENITTGIFENIS